MAKRAKKDETAKQVTERVLTSFGIGQESVDNIRGHADHNREKWLTIASGLAFLQVEEFDAIVKIAKRARAVPSPLTRAFSETHNEKKTIVETMVEHMVTDYVETLAKSQAVRERTEKKLAEEGLKRENGDAFWHRYAEVERDLSRSL